MTGQSTYYLPLEKLTAAELKTVVINQAVQDILKAYLQYTKDVLELALNKTGYDAQRFKDIGDELVLTPQELLELVNKLQVALSEV